MFTLILFLGAVLVASLASKSRRRTPRLPLPPGPSPLPFIGNALDVPSTDMPATFREMSSTYGDVIYLNALGQPMIILGSHEAATDLLDKRSANYSDRSDSPMVHIAGFAWALTMQRYGQWWRRHRRAFHQYFNPNAITRYADSQRLEVHRFALRLLNDPTKFVDHIRQSVDTLPDPYGYPILRVRLMSHFLRSFFGSAIMRISYGIEVDEDPRGAEYLKMAEDVLAIFSSVFVPGKYLAETLPILRIVPSWMPGAKFKRDGKIWTKVVRRLVDIPWKASMDAMRDGLAPSSMATGLMEQITHMSSAETKEEEEIAKNATAVAYAGGADTTFSAVQTFFLAMASYPDVQKKAQEELDTVVGPQRLPEFADKESLPYICALVKECLRWRSVVPLAVPHRSLEDDEYRGYFIPKGSIVIPNIWAISRDPDVYSDPEAFQPERFLKEGRLNPDVRDPVTFTFGYGRRICPGRHFAESSLFMIVATVLYSLSISAPVDEQGRPIPLSGKMTNGLLAYPEPFECRIEPRSSAAEILVRASCRDL